MPNTAEMIAKLATELTIQKILLAMQEIKTFEELEKYLKTMLESK